VFEGPQTVWEAISFDGFSERRLALCVCCGVVTREQPISSLWHLAHECQAGCLGLVTDMAGRCIVIVSSADSGGIVHTCHSRF
jgi:hypothetical protein